MYQAAIQAMTPEQLKETYHNANVAIDNLDATLSDMETMGHWDDCNSLLNTKTELCAYMDLVRAELRRVLH